MSEINLRTCKKKGTEGRIYSLKGGGSNYNKGERDRVIGSSTELLIISNIPHPKCTLHYP